MEHFPAPLSGCESDTLAARIEEHFDTHGFGLWALELPGRAPFIGFVGLLHADPGLPFAPAVEIGWRLAFDFWGKGLALEAARAALAHGFATLGLREIVAYTAARNGRSRALMRRLAMRRDPREDFLHPRLAPDSPLAAHVLYRLRAPR